MKEMTIYYSRKKNFGLLLTSLVFVLIGVMMLSDQSGNSRHPGWFHRLMAVFSILFFGFGGIVFLVRLFSGKVAFFIDMQGITVGKKHFIAWEDIRGFQEISIKGTKIILIQVEDPQQFVGREKRFLLRRLMQFNIRYYGTPFNITSVGAAVSSRELLGILRDYKKQAALLKKKAV